MRVNEKGDQVVKVGLRICGLSNILDRIALQGCEVKK